MANVVYIISEQKIKSFTALHENISVDDILPYILQAQDIHLQTILGSQFYSEIKTSVIESSMSSTNTDLIDEFIAPFLLNAAMLQMVPFMYMRMRNKGILKGSAEDATSADLKDIVFYKDAIRSTVDFYAERLRRELVLNPTKYPTYVQMVPKQNLLPDRTVNYSSGIAIPKRPSKTSNQNYGGGVNGYYTGYDYNDECNGAGGGGGITENDLTYGDE